MMKLKKTVYSHNNIDIIDLESNENINSQLLSEITESQLLDKDSD